MAWISEAGAAKINVPAIVGAEIRNVSRNGRRVYFEYRAYLYQSSDTWSTNVWAVWTEGNRYVVKDRSQSSMHVKYYGGWVGKSVDLDPGASKCNISVGTQGNNYDPWDPGYVTLTVYDLPTCSKPSLSALSISNVSDTSVYISFNINNTNNGSVSDSYIDIFRDSALTDKAATINSASGTFTGLDPNRTYYARGSAANAAGRSYTDVSSFTTGFTDPGAPSNLKIAYNKNEPIPTAAYTFSWDAGSAGSKPIAGYRFILYKNNTTGNKVFEDSTIYLTNEMLKDAVFSGTANKLKNLNFPVYAKTGTVSCKNSDKNTDAYNISYTKNHTILSWIGSNNENLLESNITGGGIPTLISRNILKFLYNTHPLKCPTHILYYLTISVSILTDIINSIKISSAI